MRYREFVDWEETREAVMYVMARMRKMGYVTKANFSCCPGCAGGEIATEVGERVLAGGKLPAGCVTWCRQDEQRLRESGVLIVGYGQIDASTYRPLASELVPEAGLLDECHKVECGETELPAWYVGKVFARMLREMGVRVEWDGDGRRTIGVLVPETPEERREQRMAVRRMSEAEAEEALLERVA